MNADGWGVGWWDLAAARRAGPLPHGRADVDRPLVPLGGRRGPRRCRSWPPCAAPRRRSPIVDTGNAPFAAGPGCSRSTASSPGSAASVGEGLRRAVSPSAGPSASRGPTDTEVLFALVLDALDAGRHARRRRSRPSPPRCSPRAEGRLNLLLTDGHAITATACGNSLFTLGDAGLAAGGVLVASEPLDDDPGWIAGARRHRSSRPPIDGLATVAPHPVGGAP